MSEQRRLRKRLAQRFRRVRAATERLMAPLLPDDYRIQSMPTVSPPYWNLGHTSWFFTANLLRPNGRQPAGFDGFDYALNSYYEGLGPRLPRSRRGQVASPSTEAVRAYRRAVDDAVARWIADCPSEHLADLQRIITIGCEHERQHQELFLTEILHIRWSAPPELRRGYLARPDRAAGQPTRDPGGLRAVAFAGGETTLGHHGPTFVDEDCSPSFCWDNELPAHQALVFDFALANRLITNAEWCAFVDDGGYRDPLLWLQNGWDFVRRESITAPLYWHRDGDTWLRFSLYGLGELDPHAPVCHVSFYEADAFCRWYAANHADWTGARLPREVEWEHAARVAGFDRDGANLLDDEHGRNAFDVEPARPDLEQVQQLCGTAWEWTSSHYEPYPGYRAFDGALMEYNGKFMDNQRVLRGGSFATPRSSARVAYRNFWAPETRFQVTGVRLLRE